MPLQPRALIFLDIDGVLNSSEFLAKNTGGGEGVVHHLDPERVTRLNTLVHETQASVILSSSWRQTLGLHETQSRLRATGFAHLLHDVTPRIFAADRDVEIKAYLSNFEPWPLFVVLDDDEIAGRDLGERFIHVADGLEDSHLEQARRLLILGET